MFKKTSIHICAAKYGAEKHNRREKEMKHVHSEYSHLNKCWEREGFMSVADEIRKAKERYAATHFCRMAVTDADGKQIWVPDKSKPKKMPKNSEPIREGVAVISETTTLEQMKQLSQQIELRWGIKTIGIWAHLDEGHEHLVTDRDHQKGKYLDTPEGSNVFLWNYHAHFLFDWTDHGTGQCINLNRHDMSELQDMLANTFKMERGKKSDKKWLDAHSFKAVQEAICAKEVAEYTERKKAESGKIIESIKENSNKLTKLQKAIDDLRSATSVSEESLEAVPFAEMTFCMGDSSKVMTVSDLIDDAFRRINEDLDCPIPMFKHDKWKKERNAKVKEIVSTLQRQLLSISKLHRKQINELGKLMYLDAKQKVASAVKIEEENLRLKNRISQLDEKALAREKAKTAIAERKAQEQTIRADHEEQRANDAECRLAKLEKFVGQADVSKSFSRWSLLDDMVDKAIAAIKAWTQETASVFNRNEKRVIGQGIIAQCQLKGLNPESEADRKAAANSIAEMAESSVGSAQFKWKNTIVRIAQLASEIRVSKGNKSIGGIDSNADDLTICDVTKKRGFRR